MMLRKNDVINYQVLCDDNCRIIKFLYFNRHYDLNDSLYVLKGRLKQRNCTSCYSSDNRKTKPKKYHVKHTGCSFALRDRLWLSYYFQTFRLKTKKKFSNIFPHLFLSACQCSQSHYYINDVRPVINPFSSLEMS